jgi:hypothetical protein
MLTAYHGPVAEQSSNPPGRAGDRTRPGRRPRLQSPVALRRKLSEKRTLSGIILSRVAKWKNLKTLINGGVAFSTIDRMNPFVEL